MLFRPDTHTSETSQDHISSGRIEHRRLESGWGEVTVGLEELPSQGSRMGRRGFLMAVMGLGAAALVPKEASALTMGREHQPDEVTIDRELTDKERKEHMVFNDLNQVFIPYLKGETKYYMPALVGPRSPWYREKLKESNIIKSPEGYLLRPGEGEKVFHLKFDTAIRGEGVSGKKGTERTEVITVLKAGTPVIVKSVKKNGRVVDEPVELAACQNPIYNYDSLCVKEIKVRGGEMKKFLYKNTPRGLIFMGDDGKVKSKTQLEVETGSVIDFKL